MEATLSDPTPDPQTASLADRLLQLALRAPQGRIKFHLASAATKMSGLHDAATTVEGLQDQVIAMRREIATLFLDEPGAGIDSGVIAALDDALRGFTPTVRRPAASPVHPPVPSAQAELVSEE